MDSPAERIGTLLLISAVGALATTALTYGKVETALTDAMAEALTADPDLAAKLSGTEIHFTAQEAHVTLADDAHRELIQHLLDTLPITTTHYHPKP